MEQKVTIAKVYCPDGKRLIVEGSVNGVSVTGEGFASRLATAKSEQHKTRYAESILLNAKIPTTTDFTKLRWKSRSHRPLIWIWANAPLIVVNGIITYLLLHFAR